MDKPQNDNLNQSNISSVNLFGASGHAKVVIDILESQQKIVHRLYDDNPHCKEILGKPVFKSEDVVVEGPLIISIGANRIRKQLSERYKVPFSTAIHFSALISPYSTIREGCVVMAGAIIEADATIGRHCIINTSASINHECEIGDFVHISPNATLCGNVKVGEGTWIGASTTVIPGIKIGKWCTIGAGSVVIRDIPDGVTAYGNPCIIK